ncbi:MAG: hypothetical protein K9G36_05645 [Crocinitomicaceae bacterium]|jgi:hypothetical protein|nr:hypothetical protein [Crocinitomicaceae bacterium]MCF8410467.1 hypothetical protein [Crocinitomicaceae bacterium]MCF8444059.1 hypothetical protein [Crocinitomicaceae bacterium]
MKNKILVALIVTIGLLLICYVLMNNSENEDNSSTNATENTIEYGVISTEFNQNKFIYGEEIDLLQELKECDSTAVNDRDPLKPACSPRFFRFFPLDNKTTLKNSFILLIKATVRGSETRKIKIFQREKGVLVLVNGFNGNLVERIKSTSKFDDLIIRFGNRIDQTLHYYNCLFSWNGSQYQFKSCERIDDRRVKGEFKDSMNVEIKTMLEKENYFF